MSRLQLVRAAGHAGRRAPRLVHAGLAIALALSGAACTGGPDPFSDPSVPIHIAAENGFALQLESNASTGYAWRLARPLNEAVIVLLESRYRPGADVRPGAAGVEVWRFRAVAKGETTIALEYVRSWETGVPANRTADFTVIVE